MQIRAAVILLLALVMGGVSVFLVNTYVKQQVSVQTAPQQQIEMAKVVVAKTDLKFGDQVKGLAIGLAEIPEELVPEGAFKSLEAVAGPDGKAAIALGNIKANEVLLPYKLSPHGARGGLPAKIPEDMRGFTIAVNEVRGVAGFVLPGDYVDVLMTSAAGRKDKQTVTRILLQNVKVLGIDQISGTDKTDPKVVNAVTLLVTQFDGQRLTLGQKLGELNLLLRNEFDGSILQDQVVSVTDLLKIDTKVRPKVRVRYRRPKVEVIRGLDIEEQTVTEGKVLGGNKPSATRSDQNQKQK